MTLARSTTLGLLSILAAIGFLAVRITIFMATRKVVLRNDADEDRILTQKGTPLLFWLHVLRHAAVGLFLVVILLVLLAFGPRLHLNRL